MREQPANTSADPTSAVAQRSETGSETPLAPVGRGRPTGRRAAVVVGEESSVKAREPTVAIQVVCGLIEAAHTIAGVSKAELLRAIGLRPEQLAAADARVPRALVFQLVEVALDCSGDSALGLHWAERISEGSFVPISALIPQSATLRHAFQVAAQFNRLLSDEASYELVEQVDEATLRRIPIGAVSPRLQRFADEMMVAGAFRIVRHFGVDPADLRVNFKFHAPPYSDEYTRVLERAPHFGQPFTGIAFPRALLDLPAPQRDGEFHDALSTLAVQRLWRITRQTPYAQQVRDLLRRGGPKQRGHTMAAVARALGLSARTLRRRLADEGTSYNLVLHEALAAIAKELLSDRQRTIEDIAYEMGFSDASTFHRAFKSWTGATPSSYRDGS